MPTLTEVLQHRLAAKLGEYVDRINTGVHEIAEHEIDDAILTAERDCRFRALARQRIQPGSFSSGQHNSEHPAAQGYCIRLLRHATLREVSRKMVPKLAAASIAAPRCCFCDACHIDPSLDELMESALSY